MATFTTYRCDKCEAEQESPDQFWSVAVTVQSPYYRPAAELAATQEGKP